MAYSYTVVVTKPVNVTVIATLCSAPTYTVSAVSTVARPVFSQFCTINGKLYAIGDPLITATGGTVDKNILVVSGATTSSVSSVTLSGSYSQGTTAASFSVPFGTSFSPTLLDFEPGGSPRLYRYDASLVNSSGVTTEVVASGSIIVIQSSFVRVPVPVTPPPGTTVRSCGVTQV